MDALPRQFKQFEGDKSSLRHFLNALPLHLPPHFTQNAPMPAALLSAIGIQADDLLELLIDLNPKQALVQLMLTEQGLLLNHVQTAKGSPTLSQAEKNEAAALCFEQLLLPAFTQETALALKLVLIQED